MAYLPAESPARPFTSAASDGHAIMILYIVSQDIWTNKNIVVVLNLTKLNFLNNYFKLLNPEHVTIIETCGTDLTDFVSNLEVYE